MSFEHERKDPFDKLLTYSEQQDRALGHLIKWAAIAMIGLFLAGALGGAFQPTPYDEHLKALEAKVERLEKALEKEGR